MAINDYYTQTGYPTVDHDGDSASARNEFKNINDGFDKLPALTGNSLRIVRVDASGTVLQAVTLTTAKILASDGSVTATADIPLGGFSLTGMRAGAAAGEAVIFDQMNTADASTLTSAKSYSDSGDASTLSSAKSYSDSGDASTLSSAKTYSDSGDTSTLTSANAHSDASDALKANLAGGNTFTGGAQDFTAGWKIAGVSVTNSAANINDLLTQTAATATYGTKTYINSQDATLQTNINAKVTTNGALGTPSSGTLTNCIAPTSGGSTNTPMGKGYIDKTVQPYYSIGDTGLFEFTTANIQVNPGASVSGSALVPINAGGLSSGSASPAGTWTCLGVAWGGSTSNAITEFRRIA